MKTNPVLSGFLQGAQIATKTQRAVAAGTPSRSFPVFDHIACGGDIIFLKVEGGGHVQEVSDGGVFKCGIPGFRQHLNKRTINVKNTTPLQNSDDKAGK